MRKSTTRKAPVTAWSYSRYSQYVKCHYMLKLSAIDKAPTEPSYILDRGNRIHKLGESFVRGNITGMPDELSKFGHEFRMLRKHKAEAELDLSVDKKWGPSHGQAWDTVWCRSYLDAVVKHKKSITVVDYKTGRIYTDAHMKQGSLYATCAFSHYPEAESVDVEFWYLDQDETLTLEFSRDEYAGLKSKWNRRTKEMLLDKKLLPNPGDSCKFCFHNPKKGGTCKYAE